MAEAKRAIYELTADDKAREAVRQRDNDAMLLRFVKDEGRQEADEENRQGLVAALEALAASVGVGLDASERARWQGATREELLKALVHLGAHRALPPR
ncbi:MAG: hypothetical protein JNL79_28765 [Myxococcales bacterium]|nr:hypothetical protein [Myxococcales bacterium]